MFIPRARPGQRGTNTEGLTWVEWVAAAGHAIVNRYGVYPWADRYDRKLRKAWREGEDPSDYRHEPSTAPQID